MKSNKKALISIFLVVATELIGFGLIIPILPQIVKGFESSSIKIGILIGAYSFAQFLAAPILGKWSDRIGRKPVLLYSKLGSVVAYIILAFSNNFWMFLCARLLDGFTGGNIAVARAYVSDICSKEEKSKGMAIIGIAFGFGFILGPILGGLLFSSQYGHVIPSLVASLLSFIALILTMIILKEPKKIKTQESLKISAALNVFKNKSIRIVLICYLLFMLIFAGFESTFSIFTNTVFNYNETQNSWLFVYVGLVALIIQGKIARKKIPNPLPVIYLGFTSIFVGCLSLALSTHIIFLLISLLIFSIGTSLIFSFLPALLTIYSSEENTGYVMGIYESIGSLSRIMAPLLAVYLILELSSKTGYILLCPLAILALLILSKLKKSR